MPSFLGQDIELGSHHPHGSNILKKLTDTATQEGGDRRKVIVEIAEQYLDWRDAAMSAVLDEDEVAYVDLQTRLFQDYRDLLDDPKVDVFDSRGALQPSALEEFCFFLFRPILDLESSGELAVGHFEVFQGLYFTAPSFEAFRSMPIPNYPVGNLDFVIAKRLESEIRSPEGRTASGTIYVPAVAVECKTYLDRPRYIESDVLATNIKRGFPGCLYLLVSEFLKLDLAKVNLASTDIDKIYVFRRARNVDRMIRRAGGTTLVPLHVPAVRDFFRTVRRHLREDWWMPDDWEETGILKGDLWSPRSDEGSPMEGLSPG